jgi:aminoglycoside phosphotransferase (APT) family kinase protein
MEESGGLAITADLARRLVRAQFPQWARLPVVPVAHNGWDNRTFRLGESLCVRLPSAVGYVQQVEKEHRWQPYLAPRLPLPIPTPLALGAPGEGYPYSWSVYRWLEGEIATPDRIADLSEFAVALAGFLAALYRIDPSGGPPPGAHNFYRGGSLRVYDGETQRALNALEGILDTQTAAAVWQSALQSAWHGPDVWLHGDVAPGNLLVQNGQLCAVIDFGCSAVGDPACDLVIAWTLFHGESRRAFRASLPLDAAAWARARGWALWKALILLAGHADTTALEAAKSRQVAEEVLQEHRELG